MRAYGWSLLQFITRDDGGEPAWARWRTARETFKDEPPARDSFQPAELLWSDRDIAMLSLDAAPPPPPIVMLRVYFNESAYTHIRTVKLQEPATTFPLLLDERRRAGKPLVIPEFDQDAIAIKAVWVIVKKGQTYDMPVWNGPKSTLQKYPPDVWPDRFHLPPDREQLRKLFYIIPLDTPNLVASARRAMKTQDVDCGDTALLVGLHVATKNLPDWTWATFWWDNKPDCPPYGDHRPDSIGEPWKHYKMDIALDADIPTERGAGPGAATGPNVCFNPWLEGNLIEGTVSNCLACHQRATWNEGRSALDAATVTRGKTPVDDPAVFDNTRLRLDYVWSLMRHPG
jgi:hypothetical protein